MMIAVFKTDISTNRQAAFIIKQIRKHIPEASVNIDLKDCDKVLRVKASSIFSQDVIAMVSRAGFNCSELQ